MVAELFDKRCDNKTKKKIILKKILGNKKS